MRHSWVYILRCSDGTYYVGSTTNLQQRVAQHHYGTLAGYTSSRRPVELKWSQEFGCITDAIEAERRIKKWTRAKKEALIAGDFELLHELARSSKTKSKKSTK